MMQLAAPTGPVRRLVSLAAVVLAAAASACASGAPSQATSAPASAAGDAPRVGPSSGHLIVAGGGRLGPEIMDRFIELAGGSAASIVIVPTAGESDEFAEDWAGYEVFRRAGVRNVTVLHTRDPRRADTEAFASTLRTATGVWIPGGRQWRLADAYLGTRTLRELFGVLDRGGVIGGSSAGASIQASYMVRGAVEGNTIMMAPGHERGFGFLRNAAVDQHLIARGREEDMLEVVERHPGLLGIGLDEGTAILVSGDRAEIIGSSLVAFYNTHDSDGDSYYFLGAGAVFDLGDRRVINGQRQAPNGGRLREAAAR
jgi:cyanophycinase